MQLLDSPQGRSFYGRRLLFDSTKPLLSPWSDLAMKRLATFACFSGGRKRHQVLIAMVLETLVLVRTEKCPLIYFHLIFCFFCVSSCS
jgi:hypothetical protein